MSIKYHDVTVGVTLGSGGGGILTGKGIPDPSLGNDGDVYRRGFMIPAGINFVEYLQSSGTQFIDTGIIADQGTDVVCDLEYRGNQFVVGCRTGTASSASKSLMITGSGSGLCTYKSSSAGAVSSYAVSTSTGAKCRSITNTIKADGNSYALLIPRTSAMTCYRASINAFTADYSQALFGCKQGSSVSIASEAKLYRVTYYQDGVPIADYLPCLNGNGVACMWDNVGEQYVYNTGTGNFLYGSAATPTELDDVYYVKNNGAWEVIS